MSMTPRRPHSRVGEEPPVRKYRRRGDGPSVESQEPPPPPPAVVHLRVAVRPAPPDVATEAAIARYVAEAINGQWVTVYGQMLQLQVESAEAVKHRPPGPQGKAAYVVRWEIDVEGVSNPEEAARLADAQHRAPGSTATVYDVLDPLGRLVEQVDLTYPAAVGT